MNHENSRPKKRSASQKTASKVKQACGIMQGALLQDLTATTTHILKQSLNDGDPEIIDLTASPPLGRLRKNSVT